MHCLLLSLLPKCISLQHLRQVQALTCKTSLDVDPLVAGKLIIIAAESSVEYALGMLKHVPAPDAFMYNHIIHALADIDHQRCIQIYQKMERNSIPVDSFTIAFLLKAAANFKCKSVGSQIHAHAILRGLQGHLFVGTTIVSMYSECAVRCVVDACKAFDEIPQPNVVAWNALLTACFRSDDVGAAERVIDRMPLKNLISWNIMLAGYIRAGRLDDARLLFQSMNDKNLTSWNTMIVEFAGRGAFDEAVVLFRQLLREGVWPNDVSLTGILSACSQAGALETGKILHGFVAKSGLSIEIAVSNAILDMYSRCGSIGMAQNIFEWDMGSKNIVSWTSMIAALAMYGYGDKAVELFKQMEKNGLRPDGVTFISLLYACSHSGLVEQGYYFFHRMEDVYGIQHSIEHYGCMVDIYGRAGLQQKAYDFVMKMPIKPNVIIWRTLLGACSIHGDVKLAEHVKKKILELDQVDSGDYVLLSNLYAGYGKWRDVANVRRSMSNQGIMKDPGWSSIEVAKVVYTFIANDEISYEIEEARTKLTETITILRKEGYIPDTGGALHDIEEEEKQDAIARHSEKLAVAFGMARLPRESVIRIVKNLRICHDCHNVMKMISKVFEREIIVRDRSRFHCFQQGLCSCRDYW